MYSIQNFEISLTVGLFKWIPIHFQWWQTYLWFGAVCVDTIDGKFYVFHFTAVCYWRQFDDSMEGYIQIWQIIWKSNIFFPSKKVRRNTNLTQQIRIVCPDCNYCIDCIHFKTVCIFFCFISTEIIWPCNFKSGLMEPRMSLFEGHAYVCVYSSYVWMM